MSVAEKNYGVGCTRALLAFGGACLALTVLLLMDLSRPPAKQISARGGVWAIQQYQQKLHRFTHPFVRCRLQPTCSRFAVITLRRDGLRGIAQISRRLVACDRIARLERRGSVTSPPGFVGSRLGLPGALAMFQQNPPSPEAGCAACLATTGGLVAIIVFLIASLIGLWVWVARDAKNRNVESPILWMLLVIFLSWLGLLIYLLARPGGNLVACEHCNNKKLQYSRLCPHCGNVDSRSPAAPTREIKEVYVERALPASPGNMGSQSARTEASLPKPDRLPARTTSHEPVKEKQTFCDQCGAKLEVGARFCDECGAEL